MPTSMNQPMAEMRHVASAYAGLLGRLERGDVMFHDNKVQCFSSSDASFWGNATMIVASVGDASVMSGQFSCDIEGPRRAVNVYVVGATVRMQGNKIEENLSPDAAMEVNQGRIVSALTMALLLNNTTNNQATHCIHAHSLVPGGTIQAQNQIMVELMDIASCVRAIGGTVTHDGKPAANVLVTAIGTDEKAVTAEDGTFRISTPQGQAVLSTAYRNLPRKWHVVPVDRDTVAIDLAETGGDNSPLR